MAQQTQNLTGSWIDGGRSDPLEIAADRVAEQVLALKDGDAPSHIHERAGGSVTSADHQPRIQRQMFLQEAFPEIGPEVGFPEIGPDVGAPEIGPDVGVPEPVPETGAPEPLPELGPEPTPEAFPEPVPPIVPALTEEEPEEDEDQGSVYPDTVRLHRQHG